MITPSQQYQLCKIQSSHYISTGSVFFCTGLIVKIPDDGPLTKELSCIVQHGVSVRVATLRALPSNQSLQQRTLSSTVSAIIFETSSERQQSLRFHAEDIKLGGCGHRSA